MNNLLKTVLGMGTIAALIASCAGGKDAANSCFKLDAAKFDTVVNQKEVKLFTMTNANGMEVSITNFGGRIVQILVPDKDGNMQDVVLGYDNIAQYVDTAKFGGSDFGAAIGRYANRINKGQITIDGKMIQLPTNNYGHCLHGGPQGWQYQVYEGKKVN
ncbi:MAG: galactose-1-epimerase, partial [Prevotellaceae bacterium]|nr:galactose-1-epimerase [Prevotellaceae bacterium]